MTDDVITQVHTRASNPETIHDMAQGLSPAPHVHPKATPALIAATEAKLGFPLPSLLKRIFTEVGNGGFGPGYGVHVLDDENIEATLISADGTVVWTYAPQEEQRQAEERDDGTPKEVPLFLHKGACQEWIGDWARGVDLGGNTHKRF